MEKGSIKISVIVPIYKVEQFIVRCVTSLMEQTLQNIEYIFVDDASPDNSIGLLKEVIKKYPHRDLDIKILKHAQNKGLPAARNTGLSVAMGEYIFHCDSDDYVELDMLEHLYRVAKDKNADIVWCDWFLSFEKNERYMNQPAYNTSMEALKGLLGGALKYNVWNKLIRRDLYEKNKILFPVGYNMGEDMTIIRLFAHADKVAYLPRAFYHYVQLNSGAFSRNYSEKRLGELLYNVSIVENEIYHLFGRQFEKELSFFKLNVKFPFLISAENEKYELWKSWYPEANKYILENNYLSLRSRIIQWLAWKNQFWLIKLYYKLVHRFIYGLIFH